MSRFRSMMPRTALAMLALSLTVLVACTDGENGGDATPETTPVEATPVATTEVSPDGTVTSAITGLSHESFVIPVGTTIIWENQSNSVHISTSTGNWDSGDIEPGDSFEHTFDEAGEFEYRCGIHPAMRGTVTIQ